MTKMLACPGQSQLLIKTPVHETMPFFVRSISSWQTLFLHLSLLAC